MKKLLLVLVAVATVGTLGLTTGQSDNEPEWYDWAKGVWLFGNSSYMVVTDSHYFVITANGDSANPKTYCAASRLAMTPQGMVHTERIRVTQRQEGERELFRAPASTTGEKEPPMVVDTSQFVAGSSVAVDSVWYDAVIEVTSEYVMLATNGKDRAKFYKDGRVVYMPKSGGEFVSYKVEQL